MKDRHRKLTTAMFALLSGPDREIAPLPPALP